MLSRRADLSATAGLSCLLLNLFAVSHIELTHILARSSDHSLCGFIFADVLLKALVSGWSPSVVRLTQISAVLYNTVVIICDW